MGELFKIMYSMKDLATSTLANFLSQDKSKVKLVNLNISLKGKINTHMKKISVIVKYFKSKYSDISFASVESESKEIEKKLNEIVEIDNYEKWKIARGLLAENIVSLENSIKVVLEPKLLEFRQDVKSSMIVELKKSIPDKEALKLLAEYSLEETKALSDACFERDPNFLVKTLDPKAALFAGMVGLHQLKDKLGKLKLDIADEADMPREDCQRIIVTTKDVFKGLDTILAHLPKIQAERSVLESLKLISAKDIIFKKEDSTSFEIAWGLLAILIKHDKDKPYVTTSFEVAEKAIPKLTHEGSTLVLDGHGGKGSAKFADKEYATGPLQKKLQELLNVDTHKHIDHVVLQSCTSGTLTEEASNQALVKTTIAPGKKRKLISADKLSNPNSLFDETVKKEGVKEADVKEAKPPKKGADSLAKMTYCTLQQYSHIAFTFSEHVINPSADLRDGNVGMMPVSLTEKRPTWPYSVLSSEARPNPLAGAWKSCTIVPNEKHRKFKQDRFQVQQEFKEILASHKPGGDPDVSDGEAKTPVPPPT